MYICLYIYVYHVYACGYMSVCISVYVSVSVSVYKYACTSIYTFVSVQI